MKELHVEEGTKLSYQLYCAMILMNSLCLSFLTWKIGGRGCEIQILGEVVLFKIQSS